MVANKQLPSRRAFSLGSQIGPSSRPVDAQSFRDAQQEREKVMSILESAMELLNGVEGLTNRRSREEESSTRTWRLPQSTVVAGLAMSPDEQTAQSERILRAKGAPVISNQRKMDAANNRTKDEDHAAVTGTPNLDQGVTTNRGTQEEGPTWLRPQSTVVTGLVTSTDEQSAQAERTLRGFGADVIASQPIMDSARNSSTEYEDAEATGTATFDQMSTNKGSDEASSARED